jgi:hypothetical protein
MQSLRSSRNPIRGNAHSNGAYKAGAILAPTQASQNPRLQGRSGQQSPVTAAKVGCGVSAWPPTVGPGIQLASLLEPGERTNCIPPRSAGPSTGGQLRMEKSGDERLSFAKGDLPSVMVLGSLRFHET